MFHRYYVDGNGYVSPNKHSPNDRPLAVIDPEDREQVERLAALFHIECVKDDRDLIVGGSTDAMQAALREFADPKPPKPEEPTGLGAVVEDAEGDVLVRVPLASNEERWFNRADGEWFSWDDIDAVRVLSPGVEVDQ